MKSRKLSFPAIVFIVALAVMVVLCLVLNIAMKPTITQHDFPFSITYELDGEETTIDGVYSVSYTGNDGYVTATNRVYEGVVTSQLESMDTSLILRENENHSITLYTNFHPDYLMGDTEYDYFEYTPFQPILTATDWQTYESAEGLDLPQYGAKILSWEYPEPIVNSFKFSHIAHMGGHVVIPLLAVALVALLVILIFQHRDKTLPKSRLGIVGVIFNFLIALTVLPFATIYAIFSDINGSSAEFLHQLGYVIPAIIVLALTASVSLRRRGCQKASFAVQFIGPAVFVLLILGLYITYGYG